jgi:hypothetical protein
MAEGRFSKEAQISYLIITQLDGERRIQPFVTSTRLFPDELTLESSQEIFYLSVSKVFFQEKLETSCLR